MVRLVKGDRKTRTPSRAAYTALLSLTVAASVAPVFAQGKSMAESNSPVARFLAETEPFSHKSLLEAIGRFSQKGSGELLAFNSERKPIGTCILQHTDVDAKVSGYLARVTVTQKFHNANKEKIEALYTFPLPDNAAVDDMTMKIGDRIVKGSIEEKDKAAEIYQEAAQQGYTAALLNQVRPNIFSQSVANIEPNADVDVVISYTQVLPFENGSYAFIFPTVVGERFTPGSTAVAGVHSLNPPVKNRSGHDISMRVAIDGGVPIGNVSSWLHDIDVANLTGSSSVVTLKQKNDIPNRDFVLTWNAAGGDVRSGYLTHKNGNHGYLTMMLMPPKKVTREEIAPREMIFLMDCSGSMGGAPIEKSKETMHYVLDQLGPRDSFQIITFNDGWTELFKKPQPVTEAMKAKAHKFITGLQANGGTYMVEPIKKACAIPADRNRLRIVTFMTDGYVGNDMEVIDLVKSLRKTSRWFPFGVGNSVNRFLINNVADAGGGEAETVLLSESGAKAAKDFYGRISSPVLTDVKVQFEGLDVNEIYPGAVSDVWAQKPLYFEARYRTAGKGKVILSGMQSGKPYKQVMDITLPNRDINNSCIAQQWARARVDDLMHQDWMGIQNGHPKPEIKKEIIDTALAHHIMTQFTSFVAVDRSRKTTEDKAREVEVPVEPVNGRTTANQQTTPIAQNASSPAAAFTAGGPATSLVNNLLASSRDANLFSGGGSFDSSSSASFNGVQSAGPDAFDSTAATGSTNNFTGSQTMQGATSAPALMGASNGCIGPQGSDATVISGVNTAATVRENNLANLEALLSMAANIADVLTYAIGVVLLGRGAFLAKNRIRNLVLGGVWLAGCMVLPAVPVLLMPLVYFAIVCAAINRAWKNRRDQSVRFKYDHNTEVKAAVDTQGSETSAIKEAPVSK